MRTFVLVSVFWIVMGYNWTTVDQTVQEGILNGHFTGCLLGVVNATHILYQKAYGTITKQYGFYSIPMDLSLKFDVNELTQVVGLNAVLMQLYDQGKINILDSVSRHLPEFKANKKGGITIKNLLMHNSGLQAEWTQAFPATPQELLQKIYNLSTQYRRGSKYVYSSLGPIILGEMVKRIKKTTSLQQAVSQIMIEFSMRETSYHPSTFKGKIVPGGYRNGVAWGRPFNRYSSFIDNATGLAGQFSTLTDILTYMQLMLNNGRFPGRLRILSEKVVSLWTDKITQFEYKNTLALGWQTKPKGDCPCGNKFSKQSFGLADRTGSYMWGDKEKKIAVVLLANGGIYGTRPGDDRLTKYQGKLSDSIMTALDY